MRIKTINGIDAIEAVTNYAYEQGFGEEKSIAFQVAINENSFFLRMHANTNLTDTLELGLEDKNGKPVQVTLPFVFYANPRVDTRQIHNIGDLSNFCYQPYQRQIRSINTSRTTSGHIVTQLDSLPDEMHELRKQFSQPKKIDPTNEYTQRLRLKLSGDIDFQHIDFYQLDNLATVIKFKNFKIDWSNEIRQATSIACKQSNFLILDLRGNDGGRFRYMYWLIKHLQPNSIDKSNDMYATRLLTTNPIVQEGMQTAQIAYSLDESYFFGSPLEPKVYSPWYSNEFASDDWYGLTEIISDVGGHTQYLSQLVTVDQPVIETPPIDCHFNKSKLIIITDGANCSCGFFLPYLMKDTATIIQVGGLWKEKMSFGSCRGGSVTFNPDLQEVKSYLHDLTNTVELSPLLPPTRDITFRYEQIGLYAKNQEDLLVNYAENELEPDVVLPFWGDLLNPNDDLQLYQRILDTMQSIQN